MKKGKFFIVITLIMILLSNNIILAGENEPTKLVINIPARTLTVYGKEGIIAIYSVAVGSPGTPTPTGQYYIREKTRDPIWYPMPEEVEKVDEDGNTYTVMESPEPVPAGPDNPLGKYWMGLDRDELGIHSTNNPSSIGYSVSHGCIRMHPNDVPKLFSIAYTGLRVDIIYKTTELTTDKETGTLYVAAYPDVYYRGLESYEEIEAQVKKTGIPYDPELLKKVLNEMTGDFVMVSTPYKVSIEGEINPINAIYPRTAKNKAFYISQRDWNKFSGDKIEWNSEEGKSYIKNTPLDSIIYQGRSYVNCKELANILDLEYKADIKNRSLTFYSVIMYLNGEPLKQDGKIINKKPCISIKKFFNEMGLTFTWNNETKTALFGENKFSCILNSGKAFVPVETLSEHFTLQINKKEDRVLEINSPFIYLNDISLKGKSFLYNGEVYISLRELKNICGINFEWAGSTGQAIIGDKSIAGKNFGGTAFLPLSSLYKTAFIHINRPKDNVIEISLTKIIINNSFYSVEGYKDGQTDEIMLLVDDIAKALRTGFEYNSKERTINIKGETLAVYPRNEGLYTSLNNLNKLTYINTDYNRRDRVIRIYEETIEPEINTPETAVEPEEETEVNSESINQETERNSTDI